MLHIRLERQIKFIRQELKDELLSTIERAQLKTKLNSLVTQFNELTRKACALRWHIH